MAIYKNSYPFGSIVRNGLVLSLDATNLSSYPGSGNIWYDTSGNGNSGSLTNGPTYLQERGRGSIVFDGVDDYVSGSGVILTTQGTITAWFKTANTYINNYVLSLPFVSSGNNGFDLGFEGANVFRGIVRATTGVATLLYTTTYSDNNWHMAALTYNSSNAILYYDGLPRITNTTVSGSIRVSSTGEYNIARFGSFGGYAAITASSITVYNRALTAEEVQQNFNALRNRFGI